MVYVCVYLLNTVPRLYQTEPWWVPRRGHNDVLQGNEQEFCMRMRHFMSYISSFSLVEDDPLMLAAQLRGSEDSTDRSVISATRLVLSNYISRVRSWRPAPSQESSQVTPRASLSAIYAAKEG